MSALYRVRQFLLAASACVRPEQVSRSVVGCLVPPEAVDLFWRMPAYDRRHALRVLHTLQQSGCSDTAVLAAALLHDVGKTAQEAGRLRLWHRVVVVLTNRIGPGVLERIGRAPAGGWRLPFFVQRHHAEIGARLAEQAGCTASTVHLIRRHEDSSASMTDPLLAALQAADNAA